MGDASWGTGVVDVGANEYSEGVYAFTCAMELPICWRPGLIWASVDEEILGALLGLVIRLDPEASPSD